MAVQNIFHETNDLPANVLTLVDENFYEFVEQRLGVFQSLLLKIQQINSVPCFLLIEDPCEILNLNINDPDLNVLKTKICFPLFDGSFIIKPGVKTGFVCLRDLLSKKTEEKLKQTKSIKSFPSTIAPINVISPFSSSLTQPTVAATSPLQLTITSSPQLTTSSPPQLATSSPPQLTTSSPPDIAATSIAEHRIYFLNLLKTWCNNHKDEFMSDLFDLKEGQDFILNILNDRDNNLHVAVKCNCNQTIRLTVKDGKIQLSNFQKHLRSTNCTHIKAIKKMNTEQQKINQQQATNISTSTTSEPPTSTQQQFASQISACSSVDESSVISVGSINSQAAKSKKNSCKRDQSSSQLSMSQKTKKRRT